jgi:predicted DNA-binding protein YlxM (UPF0122 family)
MNISSDSYNISEIRNIYDRAKKQGMELIDYLVKMKMTKKVKKNFCVFFDIDDTLINSKNSSNIKPIYELYQYALSKKISTIIITARPGIKDNINRTVQQLGDNDIRDYDLLYFRPEYMEKVEEFKTFARRNANECGYTPLFSIGDMDWDVGEYGGIPIVLK